MKGFWKKPYRFAAVFSAVLALATAYVFLDTFVIPRAEATAVSLPSSTSQQTVSTGQAVTTLTSYQDDNIGISIQTVRANNTTVYIADVKVTSAEILKTAFANNTYGRNISAATSAIASANKAILAINGDYYGFRTAGLVLRNGVLYRNASGSSLFGQALVVDGSGAFSVACESTLNSATLVSSGIWQGFSFCPALIENGAIKVTASSEVDQSMSSNPSTAIGMISPLHYLFVVSDGRTTASAGCSLLQLAQLMKDRGCAVAYNLDGGGSSTMVFNGKVINQPTTNGKTIAERSVSDIVYIGY
jgi:exopolysaccharide biosynthesis protein